MPRRSKEDCLVRIRELYGFDRQVALSYVASGPACPVESYSTGVPDVSSAGSNPTTYANPPMLAGFDEAGRGALAGPVIVGCVHFLFFSATASQSASASRSLHDAPVVALLDLCDNVADELPRYEIEARPLVDSEPCPHFGQAGSDVPVTDQSSPSTNPSISRSLNPSMAQSPDPLPLQSLNPSILQELSGLDDSKRLTARQREALLPRIKAHGLWGIGMASAEEIDKLGIVPAVSLAARRAYLTMGTKVDLLLCDRGLTLLRDSEIERLNHLTPQASEFQITQSSDPSSPQLPNLQITQSLNSPISRSLDHSITQSPELSFTRGDSRSLHIAAGSIIAKVTRDRMMADLDRDFPGYDFAKHKGYGTAAHITALHKLGPSSIHRRTFHVK